MSSLHIKQIFVHFGSLPQTMACKNEFYEVQLVMNILVNCFISLLFVIFVCMFVCLYLMAYLCLLCVQEVCIFFSISVYISVAV